MRASWLWCIVAMLVAATQVHAQEAVAKSKIVSVGLFNNEFAVVKRKVHVERDRIRERHLRKSSWPKMQDTVPALTARR